MHPSYAHFINRFSTRAVENRSGLHWSAAVTRFLTRLFYVFLVLVWASGPLLAAPFLSAPGSIVSLTEPGTLTDLAAGALELVSLVAFGIVIRKDVAAIAKKFVQRASVAGPDYTSGIENSGAEWETQTKASEGNFEAGVQQAIADKRFGKGVSAAGQAKFVLRAKTLGSQRYGPGIQASEADFAKGVGPSIEALRSLDLPPRRPKGDPGNMARAQAVAARLRGVKLGK